MSTLSVPNFSQMLGRIRVLWRILRSVRNEEEEKTKKLKRNFVRSYLGNGWSDFLQIWYVDYPNWAARLQQIWFQSDKGSQSYIGVKIAFSFFLLIYSRCGAPASWAARHTIVCLDLKSNYTIQVDHEYIIKIPQYNSPKYSL